MPPKWGEVRQFCLKQGYRETRTNHFHYLKVLPDHSTSGTMVSMGVDGEPVPAQMWQMVWKRQLRLAGEDGFWKGLRGEPVQYALEGAPEPSAPLPAYLLRFLREVLHLSEAEVTGITREQAQRLLNEHYARELRDE